MMKTSLTTYALTLLLSFNLGLACFPAQSAAIEKAFLYDSHTLPDTYSYRKTPRSFQWDKINELIDKVEKSQVEPAQWGILQNNKNLNGMAPLVKSHHKDKYNRTSDDYGVERSLSVPLYALDDLTTPIRYAEDGSLVKILPEENPPSGGFLTHGDNEFVKVYSVYLNSIWMVPRKYLYSISPLVSRFDKIVFVDRTNQNISTLEKLHDKWLIRSMNPTTTGIHQPPYKMETPAGIFVVQEKKRRMMYYKDGTTTIDGSAPFASRFSAGAYLHGVPIALPKTKDVEFSPSLGTTPRSHKCVRNATSHAEFLYKWAPVDQSLVIVFD